MSTLTKITLVCCVALGSLPPVSARPILHNRPQIHHWSPIGVARPGSNGVTTREVYLWRQPAKIEPHLRDVPRGKPVEVVGSQRGFYAVIMHDGLRGWMPMDAVRPR